MKHHPYQWCSEEHHFYERDNEGNNVEVRREWRLFGWTIWVWRK